ncbi:hypothetical protein CN327_12970 [Bacillus cereus]|nr:hypothetical protein CN509_22150 [Bacillus cereus]PET03912.1 hypothetical protein CN505_17215 [Bacillus cereus]PFF33691.1 hypothetical protein CN327_12970 [Bacillus cereus]PFI44330.1 hypothetical protein COI73_25355 [Bacillus cereus]
MSHILNSKNKRAWLKENHQIRKERSVRIGKQTIDLLVTKKLPITYKTISETSKEVDPEGKGIHPNTIRSNQGLNEYYKQHSKTYKQKENYSKSKRKSNINLDNIDFRRLNADRNLKNAENKYMKLSKKELVQRLLQAEQYIAENNRTWVASHFEMFK